MRVRAIRALLATFLVFLCRGALADQPTLLNIDTGLLQQAATATGAQALQLDAVQRGVTASGALRVSSPFGWALNADPAAVDEVGSRYFGPVDLATGGVVYSDIQLVLPAYASWPIGTSYGSAQTGGYVSAGMQGNNWFQASQPSIAQPSSDVIHLFYAANAFVEFKRIDSTDHFAGTNGAGGVLSIETADFDTEHVQVFKLRDQAGNEIVFFGFESQLSASGAAGQVWKYTVCKGTTSGSEEVAYVGNKEKPLTAATVGYANGHIVAAWDSAGRKFTYSYATVGGVDRLTSVVATKTVSGTTTTIATVEYAYYGQSGYTVGDNGASGDLARVQITLPTSFPAAGSSGAIEDIRENRFYYASGSRLKLVLGYEGTRAYLANAGSTPVAWNANATTLATALNSYAEFRAAYATSGTSIQVESAWFAGMDGNNGQPAGMHQFAFEGNGSFTPPAPWQSRAVVKLPQFSRYAGDDLASPAEASGSVWLTQYFDALGQPLHSVASDIDPSSSGSPKFWVTGVVRDSANRLKAVHAPANCSAYNHTAANSTRGSYSTSATDGLVTYFERHGSGAGLDGLVYGVRRGAGVGMGTPYAATNYVTWSGLSLQEVTVGTGTPAVKVRRPVVSASRVYPVATTSYNTADSFNETAYTYGWWGSPATLVPRTVLTTPPAVIAAHNGTGTSNTRKTWLNHLGQPIVTKMPNGRLDASDYDAATGLLLRQTTDAPAFTSTNFTAYADLPSGDMPTPTAIGGESTPYGVQTVYGRDALGRVVQTTSNAESTSEPHTSQTYYTRLSDRRIVRIDVPAVDPESTPAYYGPFSASVVNHLGVVEESGLISPSDPTTVRDTSHPSRFWTTNAPRTWLTEPSTFSPQHLTDVVQDTNSAGLPKLVSLSVLVASRDGSRVVEARRYTAVPDTGLGTINDSGNNHHFDRSLTSYNGMGLVEREQDITNTIDRYRFDVLGRVVRHERGTVESGTTPAPNMRPVSSVIYDGTTYNGSSALLNVAGASGRVTQVWQHPSGTFGGVNDIHSYVRYDPLGNPINIWSDEGPFLASTVDNLGRPIEAAGFDGVLAAWNAASVDVGAGSSTVGFRKKYAKSFYDELGRVYQMANFAVDPSSGAASALSSADTVRTNYYRGANGALKFVEGTSSTMIANDRLCRQKSVAVVTSDWTGGIVSMSEAVSGNLASQVVISQTNTYYDANHRHVIATVSAQRGTPNVSSAGVVLTGSAPPARGPLLSIPNTSIGGWLGVNPPDGSKLQWSASGLSPSQLLMQVKTTDYDRFLDVPFRLRDFGDPLRHATPFEAVCCGANCGTTDVFPGTGGHWPFKETELEYDPRRMLCKTQFTDWSSGDRQVTAQYADAAGQRVQSMVFKQHVSPTLIGLPELPDDQIPYEGTGACCNTADRTIREFDKGRLKLERMFRCDPDMNSSEPGVQFNPLQPLDFCPVSGSCPKDSSFGYPDYPPFGGGPLPWNIGDPTAPPPPNDNNRLLWINRPIGESPDLGWHAAKSDGTDDADWFAYDDIGRLLRRYNHAYRKSNFGDGAAATGNPADHIYWSRGGYPTEVIKPSGDQAKPWDHGTTEYDYLGRPKVIRHWLGTFGGTPSTYDDEHAFTYDRFGMLGEYKQRYNGMYPSGCSGEGMPTDGWLVCGFEREGTPAQKVDIGPGTLTPWQGPRLVRQNLPAGKVMGMAYFPNPADTDGTTMFPDGAGGAGSLLTDPRLDWAMGRTKGIYEGDGPLGDPFSVPISLYDYVGVAMPMRRSMPAATEGGYDKWLMLPTQVAPAGDGTTGSGGTSGGYIPMLRYAPDWQHRILDDLWSRPINVVPVAADPQRPLGIEGHQDIKWLSGRISSMLDPATSPSFGGSGISPVADFDVHGHDEFFRHDCEGRTIYWLAGQAAKWTKGPAESAWTNGRTAPTGVNTSPASTPAGISEAEFRWQTPETGCGTTGANGGWLMAQGGGFNVDHPLSPSYPGTPPVIPGGAEWQQHPVVMASEECSPFQLNSRVSTSDQRVTVGGSSVQSVTGWPFSNTYDAAGNLANDGRNIFRYDGSNRLRDVYTVAYSGGTQILGNKIAHFDYDALGRQVRSIYNTDGDNDLTDEDTEWTPRDVLGRPIGIWRQLHPTETSTPCAKPYQLFGYNSTGFRGTGYDASGGILDCPAIRWRDTDDDGELDETLYYLQDFRGDVTALVHPKSGIVERVRYGLTGRPEAFPAADVDFSGTVEKEDEGRFQAALAAFATSSANYDPRADLDHDGSIDSTDESRFYESFDRYVGLTGNWKLSQGDGLIPGAAPGDGGYDNRFGWRGYWYDAHLQKYHVRHRVYDPREGRWMQNDPLGFGAGDQDLYRYCGGEYSMGYDPEGLEDWWEHGIDYLSYWGGGLGDLGSLGLSVGGRAIDGNDRRTFVTDAAGAVFRWLSGDGSDELSTGVRRGIEQHGLIGNGDTSADEAIRAHGRDINNFRMAGPVVATLAVTVVLFEVWPGLNVEGAGSVGAGGVPEGMRLVRAGQDTYLVSKEGRAVVLTAQELARVEAILAREGRAISQCSEAIGAGHYIAPAEGAAKYEGAAAQTAFGRELAGQGYVVVDRGNQGVDFLVNGVEWELKTLRSGSQNAVRANIGEARAQGAARVFIDGRAAGLTRGNAVAALRADLNAGRLAPFEEVTVLVKDGVPLHWAAPRP